MILTIRRGNEFSTEGIEKALDFNFQRGGKLGFSLEGKEKRELNILMEGVRFSSSPGENYASFYIKCH